MNFNYKIIFAILLSLILGYVIYIYFFRKPVTYGEKLKDVQAQQLSLQHDLLHTKPPLPAFEVVDNNIPPSSEDVDDDDNLTRESLYEEILKLNVLKNPVDFLFKFDINDIFTNMRRPHYISEELEGLETVQGLETTVKNETSNLNSNYPPDTEAFGKINRKEQEEELLSKKIFSDMINMDKEEKELTVVPKKKKIVIKKK